MKLTKLGAALHAAACQAKNQRPGSIAMQVLAAHNRRLFNLDNRKKPS